mmetsp:Transcript_16476/g.31316  ORF Transcript_16476/g.31316 Transcript_16476/m.31316 type:complete len:486 (-) Transcript_16476:317-1774(-)
MDHSIDEGLLLTFLRHTADPGSDQSSSPPSPSPHRNVGHSSDEEEEDALRAAGPHFRAELEHFSHDAATAIHDLEAWMRLHETAVKNGMLNNNNNDAMPLQRSFDDDDQSDISDESDSENVWCLSAELSMLDAMFQSDPTSFLSPYLKDLPGIQNNTATTGTAGNQYPCTEAALSQMESFSMDDSSFEESFLRTVELINGATAVQFTGLVGLQCRSIRTRQPLPRPQAVTEQQIVDHLKKQQKRVGRRFWKRLFRRWIRKVRQQSKKNKKINNGKTNESSGNNNSTVTWLPFVMPFWVPPSDGGDRNIMCTTPRLISYYEVHILNENGRLPDEDTATTASSSHHSGSMGQMHHSNHRIAIGMTTQEFSVTATMPGGAQDSFGYHGHDGSMQYNKIRDIRSSAGHRFGVGDVVGCGIDYRTCQMFTTRNGKFLGYSSMPLDQERLQKVDWYPTIGLDTHACVTCNFGMERPFVYDLQAMIEIGKQV